MKTVTFQNVGRYQACWTEELSDINHSAIVRAILKRKVLASKAVWVDSGDIWAGDRLVGRYSVK